MSAGVFPDATHETAFQILHKLRSGMVRPNQDRIGGQPKNHVEVDLPGLSDLLNPGAEAQVTQRLSCDAVRAAG